MLEHVDLSLGPGEAIALLGHNGAGRQPYYRQCLGCSQSGRDALSFAGRALGDRYSARSAVALGMAMIPAERFVFPDLTVLENLRLGARGLEATEGPQKEFVPLTRTFRFCMNAPTSSPEQ